MKFYGKYIKPYRIFFIFGPILMLSEVIGEVLMPKMMANIINNGIPNGDTSYIISMGLAMAGIALIMMIGGVGGNYFACRATIGFSSDLRSDLYRKVQSYSFANVDHFQTGSLVTRLTNDVTQLQNFTRMCMIMMLRAPGMMIGAIIMALRINARLSLIIAAMVPILGGTIYYITSHAFPRFIAMQGKIDALNTGVQENLTNVRVIKSFVREDYERERFEQKTTDLRDHTLKALRLIIFTFPGGCMVRRQAGHRRQHAGWRSDSFHDLCCTDPDVADDAFNDRYAVLESVSFLSPYQRGHGGEA